MQSTLHVYLLLFFLVQWGCVCQSCDENEFQSPVGCVPNCWCISGFQMVSGTCQQCGVGKFSVCTGPNSNTCKCQDCAAGQYSTGTSCVSCGIGTYSDASTLFQCNSCAPHHHTLTTGARECTRCPYGKLNANPSAQVACAICKFGEYLHNNVCKPCGFVHNT